MKFCSEMHQNFPYSWNTKTHIVLFIFHFVLVLYFFPNECQHRPGHTLEKKYKLARNEKRKKQHGFSIYYKIANFEAFLLNLNLSTNHLFWRCVLQYSLWIRLRVTSTSYVISNLMQHLIWVCKSYNRWFWCDMYRLDIFFHQIK